MQEETFNPKDRSTEFAVDDGCAICGGKLNVRITPGYGAWGYCAKCRWLTRSQVMINGNVIQLAAPVQAQA
jgi:hypothetical protein